MNKLKNIKSIEKHNPPPKKKTQQKKKQKQNQNKTKTKENRTKQIRGKRAFVR